MTSRRSIWPPAPAASCASPRPRRAGPDIRRPLLAEIRIDGVTQGPHAEALVTVG